MTELIYLDRDLVVSVKPRGLLSEGEGADCFPTRLSEALREQGEKDTLFPIHRLDRETEGLILYARTSSAAAALSRAITENRMQKEYLAVLCGTPEQKEDTLRDLMFYDRSRSKSYLVTRPRKGVKEASLDYRLLESRQGLSLVHIRLHTGRTHQIRVQFGGRGLPLCGDRRYGAPATEYPLALCAARLTVPHPKDGRSLTFTHLPVTGAERVTAWDVFGELSDLLEKNGLL